MIDENGIIARMQGRAFLRVSGRYYAIRQVETSGEKGGVQEQIIFCAEIGSEKSQKFQITGYNLIEPYEGVTIAEQKTGLKQVLLIEETGDWRTFPINEELRRKFPFLDDKPVYII